MAKSSKLFAYLPAKRALGISYFLI